MSFIRQKTKIKGLSERRRLPKLGKIRLGFRIKRGNTEFPAELPFFLLPNEVAKVYGGKVTAARAEELGVTRKDILKFVEENAWRLAEEIEIMFPINEPEAVFPQAYIWYGSSQGAKCMGDGETAWRDISEPTIGDVKPVAREGQPEIKNMFEIECPCKLLKTEANPKGECTQRAHLMVMVPKVNVGGIYQIDIGSYNSIVDINSGIDYTSALLGRFAMVPLILRRVPTVTHHDKKKQVHFTLQVIMNVPIHQVEELRRDNMRILQHSKYTLPVPEEINPEFDREGVVVVETNEPENEPENNTPKSATDKPLSYEQQIEKSASLDELNMVWKTICSDPSLKDIKNKEISARCKALNTLKEKKKKSFQTVLPDLTQNAPNNAGAANRAKDDSIAVSVKKIDSAQSEEEIDAIISEAWNNTDDAGREKLRIASVSRMTQLTSRQPKEITVKEEF